MKKEYKIEYSLKKDDIKDYLLETNIVFFIIEISTLIYVLIKKMFSDDLFSALVLVLFPLFFYILFLLLFFILIRCKVIIDYKNNYLFVRKTFTKHKYDLSSVIITKEYKQNVNPNYPNIIFLVFTINGKKILKIDADSFEKTTNFKVEDVCSE